MIHFENVNKTYGKSVKAVRNLNLHIDRGEFVFVMGDSGSGKSTLIRLLLKEIEPTSGTITVDGENISKIKRRKVAYYRRKFGVVFQDFRLLKDRNVYENVAFAQRVLGISRSQIKQDVPRLLSRVGLSAKYKALPNQLSGGEQQRVAIARAIAHRPQVIFADEPTAELDTNTGLQVVKIFKELCEHEGVTIVMTTHDTGLMEIGDAVIELEDGERING